MAPRLASSVLVSALVRRAQDEGGFAAVLAKGDPTVGHDRGDSRRKGQKSVLFGAPAAAGRQL